MRLGRGTAYRGTSWESKKRWEAEPPTTTTRSSQPPHLMSAATLDDARILLQNVLSDLENTLVTIPEPFKTAVTPVPPSGTSDHKQRRGPLVSDAMCLCGRYRPLLPSDRQEKQRKGSGPGDLCSESHEERFGALGRAGGGELRLVQPRSNLLGGKLSSVSVEC